jgi:hypothetical protein
MNEIRNGLAGMFVGLSRLLTQVMHPTVDVAIFMQVIVALTLNDTYGFLRSCGIVKIDQGLTINLLVEDGELISYFVDIHQIFE